MKCCIGIKRKITNHACIFLLLGAIVNVAVAWGIVVARPDYSFKGFQPIGKNDDDYGPFRSGVYDTPLAPNLQGYYRFKNYRWSGNHTITVHPAAIWLHHTPGMTEGRGIMRSMTYDRYMGLLPSWSRFQEPSSIDAIYDEHWQEQQEVTYIEHASGWPALTLRSRFLAVTDLVTRNRVDIPTELLGVPLRYGEGYNDHLPLRPIWLGFAINTIFYSVILWMLIVGPFALRKWQRMQRIKRGLCPMCKYRIGTSVVCTECGAKLYISSEST